MRVWSRREDRESESVEGVRKYFMVLLAVCVCLGGRGGRRAFLIAPGSSAFSGVAMHFSHPYTDFNFFFKC